MLVLGNGAVGVGGLGLPEVQVACVGFTVHVYGGVLAWRGHYCSFSWLG